MPVEDTISTGVYALDLALGRKNPGYRLGEISELNGPYECGATALAIAATKSALDAGHKVIYFDFEGDSTERLSPEEGLILYQDKAQDLLLSRIRGAVISGTRLVVLDSLGRMPFTRREFPLRQILEVIRGTVTAVLVIRESVGNSVDLPWLEFQAAATTRLRLSCQIEDDQDPQLPVQATVSVEVVKSKSSLKKPKKPLTIPIQGGQIPQARYKELQDGTSSRYDREDVL